MSVILLRFVRGLWNRHSNLREADCSFTDYESNVVVTLDGLHADIQQAEMVDCATVVIQLIVYIRLIDCAYCQFRSRACNDFVTFAQT
jgi:hypothetical protein